MTLPFRKHALRALLFLALAFGLAFAQPVTVSIGEPRGEISPYAITGFNMGNMMRVVGFEEEFAALNLQALRFPPGNQGDDILLTPAVLDAFRVNWDLLGRPDLMIIANLFSATPEDAVEAAARLEERDMTVRAWAIGNEPDLYGPNRGDPSWTPERYCAEFRAYREALLAVNPDWLITGPAVSGSRPNAENYLREVLSLCGDVIDVLTWHIYPSDGAWTDEAALATSPQVGEEIRRFRSWLSDPDMNPLGYERDIGTAITEFGLSWRTANFRHLEDMPAALWLADALGQMAAEGLDESYYFTLQGLGGHGLIDNSGWIRLTYYVFEMLSDFTGEALDVQLEAPLLTTYAARNERGLQLLLINRSLEDAEVRLEPELTGELEIKTLNDEIFDDLLEYAVTTQDAAEPVAVPARSVVLLRATAEAVQDPLDLPILTDTDPSTDGVFLGVFNPRVLTEVAADFSDKVRRDVAAVMWFTEWRSAFPTEPVRYLNSQGLVPQITWEPWTKGPEVNLTQIVEGEWDDYIRQYALDAAALDLPFMLRWGHEFNGTWYPWSVANNGQNPELYAQAYRHIHDLFTEAGAGKVQWVWCFNAVSVPDEPWNDPYLAYPGDDYVDWLCMDGYNWGTSRDGRWESFEDIYASRYRELVERFPSKPILIGEFASTESGGDKAAWIADMFAALPNYPAIKAITYFDHAKETSWNIASSIPAWDSFIVNSRLPHVRGNGKALLRVVDEYRGE